jgi:hypothetical protein
MRAPDYDAAMATRPEPWLRGPVPGVPALLQPAAHAFQMALEDCEAAAGDLSDDELWRSPGAGAASVGYHLRHLAGSTDRLLTYARGEAPNARRWRTNPTRRRRGRPRARSSTDGARP